MNETIVKQSAGPQNAGIFQNKVLILTARWLQDFIKGLKF
jgi:hypothetical protein